VKTFHAKSLVEWCDWLEKHHDSEPEVWLVFYKQHTGRASVSHGDALDEALCFGWIDSLVKRLDAERFAIKFTPRKPDSRWSAINTKRYGELKALGRLRPRGIERAPTGRTYAPKPKLPTTAPPYIVGAIKKQPAAWKTFQGLAPSHRRRYVAWIVTAKLPETRERRLKEAIQMLAAGKELGLK
jgi:uncharacterized protein YdeI (YjbR/CyaY-like superfamily)